MIKLNIQILKSINNIPFGFHQGNVRKMLGLKYTVQEDHLQKSENQKFLNSIIDVMVDISGDSKESFLELTRETYALLKHKLHDDYYEGFNILYSDDLRFEAIEIFSNHDVQLIVNGIDCSDFSLKKFFTLADDFFLDEDVFYTSYSKQISFRLSEDDEEKAECILFGKPDYFKNEN